jgi:asparagine synthase (glutamine-hydrolysing)
MRSTEEWLDSIIANDLSGLKTQLSTDLNVILPSDHLVKMDIATMAASVEARSPLMDHVLGEFVAQVPDRYLLRHFRPKALLRDAYRGRLPDSVIRGRKRGFEIPLGMWLKKDFRDIIGDTLLQRNARVADYLAPSFVQDLLEQRILRDRNWIGIVYSLLMLELWLRDQNHQHPSAECTATGPGAQAVTRLP